MTISRGFKSRLIKLKIDFPTKSHSLIFSELVAGLEELYGRDIPIASIADDIVLAVYIPPQAPAPGQAFFIISLNSFSSIFPETFSPHASKAETTSSFFPL